MKSHKTTKVTSLNADTDIEMELFLQEHFYFNASAFSGDLSAGIHQALFRHLSSSSQTVPVEIVRRPPQGKVEVFFGRSPDDFRPETPCSVLKSVTGGSPEGLWMISAGTTLLSHTVHHEIVRQSSGSHQAVIRSH